MGWLTKHRIGGIHKEVKAQTKLMGNQQAAMVNVPLTLISLSAWNL